MTFLRRWPTSSFWILSFAIAWSIGFGFGTDPDVVAASYSPFWAILIEHVPKFAFTIAALVLVVGAGVDRAAFWAHLTRWKVAPRWYVLAIAGPLVAYGIAVVFAPIPLRFEFGEGWVSSVLIGADTGLLAYLFTRAGLGEEPGLRGFALGRHEGHGSRRQAALVLGILWATWHLPVLLDRDVVSIVAFFLSAIALSFVFAWMFHACGESVLVVALLHSGINAFDDVWELTIPGLAATDWEVPFVLLTLIAGIGTAVALRSHTDDDRLAESRS